MPLLCRTLCTTAIVLGALVPAAAPADAQIFYRQWSYYGHSYDRPPARIRRAPLPPDEIVDILAETYRYRRIGQPQFADHMYVVDGVDRTGAVVRSYVDAFTGRLIDVDLLQSAVRPNSHGGVGPGPRLARVPDEVERPRAVPSPPRRPAEMLPSRGVLPPAERAVPVPRQAARPSPASPDGATPPAVSGPLSIVPLSREPRVVNPAEVRLPEEADKTPPLARPAPSAIIPSAPSAIIPSAPSAAHAPAAPSSSDSLRGPPQSAVPVPVLPREAAPPASVARPAPGAMQIAPAPLDDAVRSPATPVAPPVPPAPLL
jgi:hypothetical protein